MATQLKIFPVPAATGLFPIEGGRFLIDTSSAPVDLYLPRNTGSGISFIVYDASRNAGTNPITIHTTGGELINGASTLVISSNGDAADIFRKDNSEDFIATISGINATGSSGGGGVNATAPAFGVGSPEGVVTGSPGKLYATAAGELWVKITGVGNTGWLQLLGM